MFFDEICGDFIFHRARSGRRWWIVFFCGWTGDQVSPAALKKSSFSRFLVSHQPRQGNPLWNRDTVDFNWESTGMLCFHFQGRKLMKSASQAGGWKRNFTGVFVESVQVLRGFAMRRPVCAAKKKKKKRFLTTLQVMSCRRENTSVRRPCCCDEMK